MFPTTEDQEIFNRAVEKRYFAEGHNSPQAYREAAELFRLVRCTHAAEACEKRAAYYENKETK